MRMNAEDCEGGSRAAQGGAPCVSVRVHKQQHTAIPIALFMLYAVCIQSILHPQMQGALLGLCLALNNTSTDFI